MVLGASISFVILTLGYMAAVIRWYSVPIIRASSPLFLLLSLLGACCSYVSMLSWPLENTQNICHLRSWAFTLSGLLTICPILAKQIRIVSGALLSTAHIA